MHASTRHLQPHHPSWRGNLPPPRRIRPSGTMRCPSSPRTLPLDLHVPPMASLTPLHGRGRPPLSRPTVPASPPLVDLRRPWDRTHRQASWSNNFCSNRWLTGPPRPHYGSRSPRPHSSTPSVSSTRNPPLTYGSSQPLPSASVNHPRTLVCGRTLTTSCEQRNVPAHPVIGGPWPSPLWRSPSAYGWVRPPDYAALPSPYLTTRMEPSSLSLQKRPDLVYQTSTTGSPRPTYSYGPPSSTTRTLTSLQTPLSALPSSSMRSCLPSSPLGSPSMPSVGGAQEECTRQGVLWRTLCDGSGGVTGGRPCTTSAPQPHYPTLHGTCLSPPLACAPSTRHGAGRATSGPFPRPLYQSLPLLLHPQNDGDIHNTRRIWRAFLWNLALRLSRKDLPLHVPRRAFYAALRQLVDVSVNRARDTSNLASLRLLLDLLLDLTNISWLLLLLLEYYPDLRRPARPTTDAADRGLGQRGCTPIPQHVWDAVVPPGLMERYKITIPTDDMAPRPPSHVTHVMLKALERDLFLLPDQFTPSRPNMSAFVKPKTVDKCAFIADLRGLNKLSSTRPPHFNLPSASDVARVISMFPGGALWACSIDLTNFFWSLRMPQHALGAFRIAGLTYDCPPFGWDLSPVIAQATLGHHIHDALKHMWHVWGKCFWAFHYYDDVLILATSCEFAELVTHTLTSALRVAGLLISPKSCLTACQSITWLGKRFDLIARTVTSTRPCMLQALARALLVAVAPPHPKLIRRIMGHMLWVARPRKGATLLVRGWFCHLHQGPRYLPQPTRGMRQGLFDCLALSLQPWQARDPLPPPLLTPTICMDAAFVVDHYQVGLWSPIFGTRIICAPPTVLSQQQAELFAADAATRLAARLGWTELTLIGDNRAALFLLESLRPNLQVASLVHILRRIYNRLLWTGLRAHLLWVPSAFQPADGPSRAPPHDTHRVREAMRDADRRWNLLMTSPGTYIPHGILAP